MNGEIMKGVQVYHTIQVLRNSGRSCREIANILKISKTTVQKYLQIPIDEVEEELVGVVRRSKLDPFREEFVHRLENYPVIRSSRLYRDFCKQHPKIQIGARGFRKYIQKLRASLLESKLIKSKFYQHVERYEETVPISSSIQRSWSKGTFGLLKVQLTKYLVII